MATTGPQGRLRARNLAPGFLENATTRGDKRRQTDAKVENEPDHGDLITYGYGNFKDGEICDTDEVKGCFCNESATKSTELRQRRSDCACVRAVARDVGDLVSQWVESYVAADKTFCVYLAKDEAIIH